MKTTSLLLLYISVIAVTLLSLAAVTCQDSQVTQVEALSTLETHQETLDALDGITGTEVADADGSYYILLNFASQKYIDQLEGQDRLPSSLDGVSVEVGIDNPPRVSEVVMDNILLRITTDKTVYEAGENVLITAYAENVSSQRIYWEYFSVLDEIPIGITSVEGDDITVSLDRSGKKYVAMTLLAGGYALDPGESTTVETFWDQRLRTAYSSEEFDASFGRYYVSAVIGSELPDDIFAHAHVTIWAGI